MNCLRPNRINDVYRPSLYRTTCAIESSFVVWFYIFADWDFGKAVKWGSEQTFHTLSSIGGVTHYHQNSHRQKETETKLTQTCDHLSLDGGAGLLRFPCNVIVYMHMYIHVYMYMHMHMHMYMYM